MSIVTLKWYYDQNFPFLFLFIFGTISDENLPCQVLFKYSRGKSDFFNVVFRLRLSTIARFKKDRVQSKDLGLVARHRKWRQMRTSGQTNGGTNWTKNSTKKTSFITLRILSIFPLRTLKARSNDAHMTSRSNSCVNPLFSIVAGSL